MLVKESSRIMIYIQPWTDIGINNLSPQFDKNMEKVSQQVCGFVGSYSGDVSNYAVEKVPLSKGESKRIHVFNSIE